MFQKANDQNQYFKPKVIGFEKYNSKGEDLESKIYLGSNNKILNVCIIFAQLKF